jgi:hypothetical protein
VQIDISDISKGIDKMTLDATKNVLMNNFASLVDIFLHYARPKQTSGLEAEGADLAISMKSMATFVRTCRLSSEHCSFFEIQRACVRCCCCCHLTSHTVPLFPMITFSCLVSNAENMCASE